MPPDILQAQKELEEDTCKFAQAKVQEKEVVAMHVEEPLQLRIFKNCRGKKLRKNKIEIFSIKLPVASQNKRKKVTRKEQFYYRYSASAIEAQVQRVKALEANLWEKLSALEKNISELEREKLEQEKMMLDIHLLIGRR